MARTPRPMAASHPRHPERSSEAFVRSSGVLLPSPLLLSRLAEHAAAAHLARHSGLPCPASYLTTAHAHALAQTTINHTASVKSAVNVAIPVDNSSLEAVPVPSVLRATTTRDTEPRPSPALQT